MGLKKIKCLYFTSFKTINTPNKTKMIRLAQELTDISTALTHKQTNTFIKPFKDGADFSRLLLSELIKPILHIANLFFEDNYPKNPPKVNLKIIIQDRVRFNSK